MLTWMARSKSKVISSAFSKLSMEPWTVRFRRPTGSHVPNPTGWIFGKTIPCTARARIFTATTMSATISTSSGSIRQLIYTCAYFPTPRPRSNRRRPRKWITSAANSGLQPGETVVEAGCGWGALAIHMAREYGVKVKAFNVSREQIAFARERARAERLSDRVEFIEDDYRTIRGKFDAFVSVGMLEHVGEAHFGEFSDVIEHSIGKTGRGLVHFIGRNYPAVFSRWMRKRIFPGAYIPSLKSALNVLEPKNYAVLDVENLRMHYAKTLEHWLDRFERSRQQVTAMYDSRFVRAWRLYLAGSLAAFRVGHLQLFQILFTGSEREPLFWTRDPLYAGDGGSRPGSERMVEKVKWTHAMS